MVIAYAAGFIAAQYYAVWVFRGVLANVDAAHFVGSLTPRYFVISTIEAALAVASFAVGARRGSAVRSMASVVLASALGFVAAGLTVGAWPIVPRLTDGVPQLLLQALAGAIISYFIGVAMTRQPSRNDS